MHAGKKRFQYLTVASAVIAALVAAAPVRTASARDSLAPNCSDGTYKIGTAEAHYLVCLPSVWNGDLVVYAHGYVNPYEPLAVQDNTIDGVPISQIVTGLGFAYAATSYRQNGLVIPEAVEDVRELVDQFPLLAGAPPPNHVYLVGASEGGLVTALAMEKYREFSGGLATCGPVGSFRQQINYFGDFLVIFNYFFPDVLKGLANGETSTPEHIPDALLGQNWDDIQAAVLSAITSNPSATKQLLRVTGAAVDPTDISSVGETILGVLQYDIYATNDAVAKLGGHPYDNRLRWYTGSNNDLLLNLRVRRFQADGIALRNLEQGFQTSGRLLGPVVTLHTTADPIVPYWQEPIYGLRVLFAGSLLRHVNIPVFRYGHCSFNQNELLAAFSTLRTMVALGW